MGCFSTDFFERLLFRFLGQRDFDSARKFDRADPPEEESDQDQCGPGPEHGRYQPFRRATLRRRGLLGGSFRVGGRGWRGFRRLGADRPGGRYQDQPHRQERNPKPDQTLLRLLANRDLRIWFVESRGHEHSPNQLLSE